MRVLRVPLRLLARLSQRRRRGLLLCQALGVRLLARLRIMPRAICRRYCARSERCEAFVGDAIVRDGHCASGDVRCLGATPQVPRSKAGTIADVARCVANPDAQLLG